MTTETELKLITVLEKIEKHWDLLSQNMFEEVGNQLRAKINGKFQTAAFLAGWAFTVLGIQLTMLYEEQKIALLPISIAIMLSSIVLFIYSVIKLDELTMPKRFWVDNESKQFDEKSFYLDDFDLIKIKKQMVFHWINWTLVGIYFNTISLFIMLIPIKPFIFINPITATFASSSLSIIVTICYVYIRMQIGRKRNKYLAPLGVID